MRLSKPNSDGVAKRVTNGKAKRFHAEIVHHKGGASTHQVSSHATAEDAHNHYKSKFPKAYKIECKEC